MRILRLWQPPNAGPRRRDRREQDVLAEGAVARVSGLLTFVERKSTSNATSSLKLTHSKCKCGIFVALNLLIRTLPTCKHHHVLEIGLDLVAPSEVEKEGERVDVSGSSQEHGDLEGQGSRRGNGSRGELPRHRARAAGRFQRYEGSDDEHGIEDVILEGEEGQAHVGEDEVLCQEIQEFKELRGDKRRR